MEKITLKGEISGKSANNVFDTFIKAFEETGFEIWKTRPLAWLCIAKRIFEGNQVDANLVARATTPVSYTLTMTCSSLPEDALYMMAEKVLEVINDKNEDN